METSLGSRMTLRRRCSSAPVTLSELLFSTKSLIDNRMGSVPLEGQKAGIVNTARILLNSQSISYFNPDSLAKRSSNIIASRNICTFLPTLQVSYTRSSQHLSTQTQSASTTPTLRSTIPHSSRPFHRLDTLHGYDLPFPPSLPCSLLSGTKKPLPQTIQ